MARRTGTWRLDLQVVIGLAATQHNSGDDSLQWLRSQDKSADQAGSDQWLHHLGASWHAQISSGVDVFSEP